jgi:glycosyltransferase involved in cell wall biosynthesis
MKILFITWDGPQASYMEGLFMPIFNEIVKKEPQIEFHILQFTWDNDLRVKEIENQANKYGFIYSNFNIIKKIGTLLGSVVTILKGAKKISSYIVNNNIDVVMPRSTLPAIMINIIRSKHKSIKIIFDADGLPLEERIEDGTLKKGSLVYKLLRTQEKLIIKQANSVLVRAQYAINYHIESDGNLKRDKFFIVTNGRNPETYNFKQYERTKVRQQLNVNDTTLLIIYIGSLGNKYSLKEMVVLYEKIKIRNADTKFLVLSPSVDYLNSQLDHEQIADIIIKTVPSAEVSQYLSAADLAFCLINQSLSMRSVAATKLGEYFLAGLPVIATSKIGDADYYLKDKNFCFLLKNYETTELEAGASWATANNFYDRGILNLFGQKYFSLEASANFYLLALNSVVN